MCLATLACSAADAPRSLLLITLDTVRADHLSAYGYALPTTPVIETLAERGVLFEAALAPSSSTAPTHASLFTGRYPSFHSIGAFNGQFPLLPDALTVAEIAADAGVHTAAIVSNPLLAPRLGLDQGFAHYDADIRADALPLAKARTADRAVDLALAWLAARPPGAFFLWLHLQDAHGPYLPQADGECPLDFAPVPDSPALPFGVDQSGHGAIPLYQRTDSELRVAHYERRYDCAIRHADRELGRLLERVRREPGLRNLSVVLTADHGEALGEDGFFFAHGHGVGLDQVRVPLVVAGPEVRAGARVDRPVSLVALFPTLLELLGIAPPDGAAHTSLLPLLRGDAASPEERIYVESLNQLGVALGGELVRRDWVPAAEREFWAAGNPNAGGSYWEPLGGLQRDRLGSPADPEASAEALLADYRERAARERARRPSLGTPLDLAPSERALLESLGYALAEPIEPDPADAPASEGE